MVGSPCRTVKTVMKTFMVDRIDEFFWRLKKRQLGAP